MPTSRIRFAFLRSKTRKRENAIRQHRGFAKNEKVTGHLLARGIIEWRVAVGAARIGKVNNLTLPEYLARIEKIRRSVKLHSDYGARGYYEFVRNFM